MSKLKLSKKQKEELEKFGANTWYVEYLYDQYEENPENVPEMWKKFFGGTPVEALNKNGGDGINGTIFGNIIIDYPQPGEDDDTKIIAGSAERILDNMNNTETDEQWTFYSIVQYISENFIGLLLLVLAFFIIYIVDHVNRINSILFAPQLPVPIKVKSKKIKK